MPITYWHHSLSGRGLSRLVSVMSESIMCLYRWEHSQGAKGISGQGEGFEGHDMMPAVVIFDPKRHGRHMCSAKVLALRSIWT